MTSTSPMMPPTAMMAASPTTSPSFLPRVLLALDDPSDQFTRRSHLAQAGYSVSVPSDGSATLMLVESFDPDVIMLDTTQSISSTLTQVRPRSDGFIIVLQSAPHPDERITLLRDGADDVLPASISAAELNARCDAIFRRRLNQSDTFSTPDVIAVGPLEIDRNRHEVRLGGVVVPATRIEFALSEQLAIGGDSVSTREHLIEQVWGPHWVGDPHVVDVHLSNLRRKLDHALPGTEVIHTVRGVGFRLSDDLMGTATNHHLRIVSNS